MASQRFRAVQTNLTAVIWYALKLGIGLISLGSVWTIAVLYDGILWAKNTEDEKKELAVAQDKHWSLEKEPLPGYRHAFFTTSTGTSLHYVVNTDAKTSAPRDIAIFIHGFPDSFLLWRHMLQSPELYQNHFLIAVDIPGYGGSDGLPTYGPNEMLEALTEYVLGMRRLYLREDRRVVVVTHDWGTLIAARLASHAGVLADHWVLASGVIPHLMRLNALNGCALASQMLRTWVRQPSSFGLLMEAATALGPIATQMRHSFYIFCFNLPPPFSSFFTSFGNYWFLRILHSLGKGKPSEGEQLIRRLDAREAGEAMSISTGPVSLQVQHEPSQQGSLRYGESVRRRVHDRGMSEKIRIYREGLFVGKWELSQQTVTALSEISGTSQATPVSISINSNLGCTKEGSLQAPTTLVLGEHDPAFDWRLGLDGVEEFLVAGGQVLLVTGAGHWLPLETHGRRVLEDVVSWALRKSTNGRDSSTPKAFLTMSGVQVLAEVRKNRTARHAK